MNITGYGNLITGITQANLVAHPDNDGSFLIQVNGQNLSLDSNGNMHFTSNAGPDEKWWQGNKCMTNLNSFQGNKYSFLEWFD